MGAACCVAARDATLPNRCLGDKRCRVVGATVNSPCQPSDGRVLNGRENITDRLDLVTEYVSGGGTPGSLITPTSQKSPAYEGPVGGSLTPSDASSLSNHFTAVHNPAGSPEISETISTKLPFSMSSPPFSAMRSGPSGSKHQLMQPNTTPSRRPRRSPGHQLFRQISDSRILGLKSPNSSSFSEGRRPSFVLSPFANDLATGSRDRSSDGWSLRTFSELVASSHRERWSFDSEAFGSGHYKISGSSSRFFNSPSTDLRTCGACSKLLSERASLGNEVPVVALLVCGHVYHADCLDNMTEDASKYDPACPICTIGEKQVLKMSRKAMKAEAELKLRFHKRLNNRVMDSYFDNGNDSFECMKSMFEEEEKMMVQPCSSSKLSSGKPFLKRRFAFGSKWAQTASDSMSSKKRGFWGKYRGI